VILPPELRTNWTRVLSGCLIAGVVPLLALIVDGSRTSLALAAVAYSLVLLVMCGVRALHWLKLTLFFDGASLEIPGIWEVQAPQVEPDDVLQGVGR